MSQNPTGTLGKYQIIREIARSNDIVYEAYDPDTNRRIAIKELASQATASQKQRDDRLQRFRREARAAGSLVHPNIVTIYEVGEDSNRHFIAMEYLDGKNLRDELDDNGALDIPRALQIAIDVLSGLKFAHDRGVIHRDIKPENIQLLSDGRIKITDFGIARLTFEPNLTMDGQVFGTPSYMSPEQIGGRDIDPRTDIFSVGVVLYEMIDGKKPFSGDNVMAITYAIMNTHPEQPQSANYTIWSILQKALDKTPHLRYDHAREMIDDLKAAKLEIEAGDNVTVNQQPGYYAPQAPPFGQAPPMAPGSTPWGANPYGQAPQNPYLPNPYQQNPHGQPSYSGPAPPQIPSANPGNPYAPPTGAPNPYHPSYAQPAPGAPVQQAQYGGYPPQQPQQGNPYGGPSVIPLYLPPPRRRPSISPATKNFFLKLVLWFILIGSLIGATIYFVNSFTTGTASPGAGRPLDWQGTGEGFDPQSAPVPASSSEFANASPGELLSQAETAIQLAVGAPFSERRDAYFQEAAVRFVELIAREGSSNSPTKQRAAQMYFDAAGALFELGDSQGARSAIYYAKSFTTDPSQIEILDAWLEVYGA